MTQPKIGGKFYPLQHEEWLKACRELRPAERDVLYYLRTLDPYSSGIELTSAAIARDLSASGRTVHRQTVSRALKELDRLGFIDIELLAVRVVVRPKGLHCQQADTSETPMVCGDTKRCDEAPSGVMRHQARSPHTKQLLGALPSIEPTASKTYLDFIRSLSDSDRESFLEFGKKKAGAMPKPPELSLKWIEVHWEELRSQWEETEPGRVAKSSQTDWTSHPDWQEWLDFMRDRGVPTFVALGEWLDRKTRREIANWAEERNLVWGTES